VQAIDATLSDLAGSPGLRACRFSLSFFERLRAQPDRADINERLEIGFQVSLVALVEQVSLGFLALVRLEIDDRRERTLDRLAVLERDSVCVFTRGIRSAREILLVA